jgi:hypothetical protein
MAAPLAECQIPADTMPMGRGEIEGMDLGPVEYLTVAFPGNRFNGQIAPALEALIESQTIRILDVALIVKDEAGNVVSSNADHPTARVFAALDSLAVHRGGVITDEDLRQAAERVGPNSSAGILVWEDLWALRFTSALANSGAEVLDLVRVPRDFVEANITWNNEHRRFEAGSS